LFVGEAPTASKRLIELDNDKPPIARGLGKRKFRWIEKLLSLQNLVVTGKATEISPVRDRDRFSQRGHLALLLFLESA
jgi:hypothetical protein